MKIPQVFLLALIVSAVSSLLTVAILSIRSRGNDASHASGAPAADVASALDAIRREQAELWKAVEELRTSAPSDPGANRATGAPGVTAGEVEAIVSRAVEELVKRDERAPPDPGAVAAAFRRLLDPNLSDEDRSAIWAELARAGLIDAVVAEFERRAESSPQDATAYVDLGAACLQRMRYTAGGPEAGAWGRKGSEAYAKALELDETNWAARFAQARHFLDAEKRGDAIAHLEILREQQKGRASEARHAEAFVLLGDLYRDRGDTAKAKEVWVEGSALFPDHELLRALAQSSD